MGVKKLYSLNYLIIQFVLSLMILLILGVVVPIVLSMLMSFLGILTSPLEGEKEARNLSQKITEQQKFNENDVSYLNEYLLLSSDGKITKTNMTNQTQNSAIEFIESDKTSYSGFIRSNLNDGNKVILKYKIKASYTNEFLESNFISPEILMIIVICLNMFMTTYIWTKRFSKKIKNELLSIDKVVKSIQNNDLNFDIEYSNIIEFNQLLGSSDKMKNSLIENLEENWSNEKKHRDQIAALIHDINTPLTGAIGWSDLLLETSLTLEQKTFIEKLKRNQDAIETLMNNLMVVTLDKKQNSINKQEYHITNFGRDILDEVRDVAAIKTIDIDYSNECHQLKATFDYQLLFQAVINIFSNAIDFTPKNGTIRFTISVEPEDVTIIIEDSGIGFFNGEQHRMTESLYRGDQSRSGVNHFGMGLAIAKNNISKLNGEIIFDESYLLGGALVKIKIPK